MNLIQENIAIAIVSVGSKFSSRVYFSLKVQESNEIDTCCQIMFAGEVRLKSSYIN